MENRAHTDGEAPRGRTDGAAAGTGRAPRTIREDAARADARAAFDGAGQPADRAPYATAPAQPAARAPYAAGDDQTAARTPYQHTTPHITQEPIADDPTRYVTRERYTTLEQARPRRHMGVATSDPQYLPVTEPGRAGRPGAAESGVPGPAHPASAKRAPLHYDRYLQTPKPGKSIFSSRHERARRRTRAIIVAVLLVAVVAALVWFFVLR